MCLLCRLIGRGLPDKGWLAPGCERHQDARLADRRYPTGMSIPLVKRRARSHAVAPRTVVAVIGSGQGSDPHAAEVGRLIAALGYDLLTGAGGGVMEAVSRAFFETTPRRGIVIGVVPGFVAGLDDVEDRIATDVGYDLPQGYPNAWVELAIYTHLPDRGAGAARAARHKPPTDLSA